MFRRKSSQSLCCDQEFTRIQRRKKATAALAMLLMISSIIPLCARAFGFLPPQRQIARIVKSHGNKRFHQGSRLASTSTSEGATIGESFNATRTCSNFLRNSSDGVDNLFTLSLSVPTMETMEEVGALLAVIANPPDVIFLDGDLGAGKTTFARGFVQCKLGGLDDDNDSTKNPLQVTSPTYLLSNTYAYQGEDTDSKGGSSSKQQIHHMDLYRLPGTSPKDFEPLALPYVFSHCISLIEWPSRLSTFPEIWPPLENLLEIDIQILLMSEERVMSLTASRNSSWTERLQFLLDEEMIDDLIIQNHKI